VALRGNPWLGIDAATAPSSRAREARREWEQFVGEGRIDGTRAPLADSWRRSLAAGVDPSGSQLAPVAVDRDDAFARWRAHPLAEAAPLIRSRLASLADASEHLIVISDANGMLLRLEGDAGVRSRAADSMNFTEGALWSEHGAGTNAIGTALAADHAVQIFATEHFVEVVQAWTCSAAPVHDPETGELLGVIDLTGPQRRVHPQSLKMAIAAAHAVESHLRWRLRERDRRLRARHGTRITGAGDLRALVGPTGRVLADDPRGWLAGTRLEMPPGGGGLVLPSGDSAFAEPVGDEEAFVVRMRAGRRATHRRADDPTRMLAEIQRLADEQAALRRVATLVAHGLPPGELFNAVAAEVGGLLGADLTAMVRYEPDDTPAARIVAAWPAVGEPGSMSGDWPLDDAGLALTIARTCRPSRIDDWARVPGPAAAFLRDERGIVASVGAPVVVEGHLWGALLVHMTTTERLPADMEARVAGFAELAATAIANAEARAEVQRLAEEQAALRRVATLVAQGASPTAVLDAVAAEMEGLLDADGATLSRYERGGEVTVVAHRGSGAARVPPGTRVRPEAESVTAIVRRTERPARIESYRGTQGAIGELVKTLGVRAAVGAPITVDGRLWGVVIANWRGEEHPPAGTEQRMAQFAELLDTAIANADGRDQLTASRERLLTAGDDARRRVVRDLHDGAQQRLVNTIVTLKLARRALHENDAQAESLVDEALEHAEQGHVELRELAHGILPAVLTRGGLRAGVGSLVARLDLPVVVDVGAARFPAEIEASAYFIVAEALTNVVKHAHAERAHVNATVEDGMLRVEIRDDGIGGTDPDGHGLVGMRDRATALGGRLDIESPASGGTFVAATLPLPRT
jgi:signal transduction histidine kinase